MCSLFAYEALTHTFHRYLLNLLHSSTIDAGKAEISISPSLLMPSDLFVYAIFLSLTLFNDNFSHAPVNCASENYFSMNATVIDISPARDASLLNSAEIYFSHSTDFNEGFGCKIADP